MDLDFETLGIDIALYYGLGDWPGMDQTLLAQESLVPVARFEHYYMAVEATLSGLGIALLPSILVESELQQKRLFALPDYPLKLPECYYILHYTARWDEWKSRAFKD